MIAAGEPEWGNTKFGRSDKNIFGKIPVLRLDLATGSVRVEFDPRSVVIGIGGRVQPSVPIKPPSPRSPVQSSETQGDQPPDKEQQT